MGDIAFRPISGRPMTRDVRLLTLTFEGRERTFPMPGWSCDVSGASIFTNQDTKVSDHHLARLMASVCEPIEKFDTAR